MKANELRIGNLVDTAYGIKPVYGILGEKVYQDDNHYINCGGVKPIPLTPEWLERAGLETKIDGLIYIKWYIGINPVTQDYLFDITWISNSNIPFHKNGHFKIDYVHQLQNLYFALTGYELEFTF